MRWSITSREALAPSMVTSTSLRQPAGICPGQPEPIGQKPRHHHPRLGHCPSPTNLDLKSVRPPQRGSTT
ncbi:MAG: hypothetical protein ACREQ5_16615 [Candidatus Dormibacteria bacterium]